MSLSDSQEESKIIRLSNRPVPGGVVRESVVSSSHASKNPCLCPSCGGGNVFVEGQFRREFSEEFIAGESQGYKLDSTTELEKNVLAVVCADCKVRYVIEPDMMFRLREQVVELAMEMGRMSGLNAIETETDKVQ